MLGLSDPIEESRQWMVEINRSFVLVRDPEALRSTLAARVRAMVQTASLLLFERDLDQPFLYVAYNDRNGGAEIEARKVSSRGRLVKWLEANDRCMVLADSLGLDRYLTPEERELIAEARADLCVPIVIAGKLNGLLLIELAEGASVDREAASRLELLAGQAGLALESAHLHRLHEARLKRLQRAERLASVGKLAAGTAHEIRNPLTAIRSTMQYFQRSFDADDERHEAIRQLLEEVDRIDRTLDGLLRLTRSTEYRPQPVDLTELLADCVELHEAQASRRAVTLRFERPPAPLPVHCDPDQMRQVVFNLLANALQAMPEGGRLEVRASKRPPDPETDGRGWALIEVGDTGPGIAEEEIDHCFDPFFTTKPGGTGLGLPISASIVEQHGGGLKLTSRPGEGTTVSVRLPLR